MDLLRFGILTCVVVLVSTLPHNEMNGHTKEIERLNATAKVTETAEVEQIESVAKTPQMDILEMKLSDQDQEELLALNGEISQQMQAAQLPNEREARTLAERPLTGDRLSEEDISKIVHMISFPVEKPKTKISEAMSEIEPRYKAARRSLRRPSHGYFIIAVAPDDQDSRLGGPKYSRLNIIPAERSVDGAVNEATDQDVEEEERLLVVHKLSKYLRRLLRRVRRGAWGLMRQTFFRTPGRQAETDSVPLVNGFYVKQATELKALDV